MDILCNQCQRAFKIDDAKVANVDVVRCLCGASLVLRERKPKNHLGKYVLKRRIASGGMGEIFYAKSAGVEGFEREFAIKRMLPHLSADPNFINMMVKEAKLTVLLNHPNIVQVYDLAKEGDQYFIAMEYVPAINIGQLLEYCRGKSVALTVPLAVHVAAQTLKGLGYAHNLRGPDGQPMHLLHRDITPANILITKQAWVKITDFGIAKARNEISTTSPGMIRGKLGYFGPEQLAGREADHRLDIFCVGILLWEMLAARRLFKGADEVETIRLITDARVPSLRAIRKDVPVGVEACVYKALSQRPEDRYQDADEFYDRLVGSVAPLSADDCANAARGFLADQPGAFERLFADDVDLDTGPKVALKPREDGEITITEVLATPPRKPRKRTGLILGGAGLVAALGVAAVFALGHQSGGKRPVIEEIPPLAGIEPLSQGELQLAISAERSGLLECYKLAPRELRKYEPLSANLVIASTGGVASISLSGPEAAWGKALGCVRGRLEKLRFRNHSAPSFSATVDLPGLEVAEAPAAGTATSPSPGPSPRSQKPLTEQEIQATVQRYFEAIAKCLRQLDAATAPSRIAATMSVDTNGKVTNVALEPPLTSPPGRCLTNTIKSIRFRPGPKTLEITVPLNIESVKAQ